MFDLESVGPMIKESLFAAEEPEPKLDPLGNVWQLLETHVNFAALTAKVQLTQNGTAATRLGERSDERWA